MFNELEETLGLSTTPLDWVENVFRSEVGGYFDRVQEGEEAVDSQMNRMTAGLFENAGKLHLAAGRPEEGLGLMQEAARLAPKNTLIIETLKELIDALRGKYGIGGTVPNDNALSRLADLARIEFENRGRTERITAYS